MAFQFQQEFFNGGAPSVAAQAAIAEYHPVAGDEDGNRIPAVGITGGPVGLRFPHRLGQPQVTARFPIRDRLQFAPDFALERSSLNDIQWQ